MIPQWLVGTGALLGLALGLGKTIRQDLVDIASHREAFEWVAGSLIEEPGRPKRARVKGLGSWRSYELGNQVFTFRFSSHYRER